MNSLFFAVRTEGVLLPNVRIKRLARADRSPNVQIYRRLQVFAPTKDKWQETPQTEEGWKALERFGLSKDDLFALWDNMEADVQELDDRGEWRNAFEIQYPDKEPVKTD